ncbi:MAG: saccharopine dehydrogenase NADP-binding domain-containing protein [Desulfosalsimonas sp.]
MTDEKNNRIIEADIVIWGATGFVGRLAADYLWQVYGKTDRVRLALGGRRHSELKALHRDLKADERLQVIVGDALDTDFLDGMTRKARLVISTVGPYARYGSPLVAACAENGCDYCDLAGEPQWIHRMIRAHQKDAEASGARIVNACGFDSIPSDMGVYFLQKQARQRLGRSLSRVKMLVRAMRGGASGGTVASIINLVEESRRNPEVTRILKNPYSLAPAGMQTGVRQPGVSRPQFDADAESWVAPFVMAAVNTRIVHRSNALADYYYGSDFKYHEAVLTGKGFKGRLRAIRFSVLTGVFFAAAAFAPARKLMQKLILPKPGQGPSRQKQEKGFYKLAFIGKDNSGNRMHARVEGDRDPGYGSTKKMLAESAVCLLHDIPEQETGGGFWTPSTAMGEKLLERLVTNAGLSFKILES